MILPFQEISEIHGCRQTTKKVSGRTFSLPSKVATHVINDFKVYFNVPAAAILSQNQ